MQHPLKNIMCLPRWHVCLMKKQHCFNGILLSESSFFYQKHFLPFSRLFFMSILIFVDVIWRECLDGILSELPQMLTWSYGWTEQICKVFTGELIRITLDKHAWKLKHHWFTEACKCNAIFLVLFGLCESLNNLCPWAFLLCNILWFCILRPIFKETPVWTEPSHYTVLFLYSQFSYWYAAAFAGSYSVCFFNASFKISP